jgi:hypothetical protein
MEGNGRRIGVYAATGVLIAVLVIAGIFLFGVEFPSIPGVKAETGTFIVLLIDAPVNLTYLNVTIDSFSVHGVDEGWINIPFGSGKNEVSFDLLALYNVTLKLANATIPAGNYNKMRMTIKNANATYADGNWTDLTVPPGHIDIIIRFEVEASDTTIVLIDMEADWVAISKSNRLRPVLKASVVE